MERLFLRPAEAAELIGFCRTSMYKLIRQEEIPFCRVGKSIRISVSALKQWAEVKGLEFQLPKATAPRRNTRKQPKGKAVN